MTQLEPLLDVVIVGGGPAGLSCALNLARSRRRIALFDDGVARNDAARATHGFLTRDGASPAELKRIAREQLVPYGVVTRAEHVVDARSIAGPADATLFEVKTASAQLFARKLVLATGLCDLLPDVDGFARFYGTSIWHCPHCDGWEARDRKLAVLTAGNKEGVEYALAIRAFSDDVMLFTNRARLEARWRPKLKLRGIPFITEPLASFEGDAQLSHVVLASGERIARDGLFFHIGCEQRSPLPARLGCVFDKKGAVKTVNRGEESTVPGVYVVGDASEDARLIVVAAAEGAKAALHIQRALRREEEARLEGEPREARSLTDDAAVRP